MKLIQQQQQQTISGQPPEKKLRVNGAFTNGTAPSNHTYQVCLILFTSIYLKHLLLFREILINNNISLFTYTSIIVLFLQIIVFHLFHVLLNSSEYIPEETENISLLFSRWRR